MNEIWAKFLADEINSANFETTLTKVYSDSKEYRVFPSRRDLLSAFNYCPFDKVSVVIIGQDPYHGDAQANGLAFSVNGGVKIPPSLQNILKEVRSSMGLVNAQNGDLKSWAMQGVLLLNSILTVRESQPGSHSCFGWQNFSDSVIKKLSEEKENMVFMLWGNYAKSKERLISGRHLILKATHPSPFSAYSGFFGCNHFKLANDFLQSCARELIKW